MNHYYCKQVPVEIQGQDLFYVSGNRLRLSSDEDVFNTCLEVCGKAGRTFTSPFIDNIESALYKASLELEYNEALKRKTITDILNEYGLTRHVFDNGDYIPSGKSYSPRMKKDWKDLLSKFSGEIEEITLALSMITGETWKKGQITGSCQSDWAIVIYSADHISDEDLARFSSYYFNLGSEWLIPATATEEYQEDDEYVATYITEPYYSGNEDKIRKVLSEYIGCDESEVLMGIPQQVIAYNYI